MAKKVSSCTPRRTPETGLQLLVREKPDLVVTDLRLPGMSGLEFLQAVKRANAAIPVVVMTAYGTVESAVEAMKVGASNYVTKPFSFERARFPRIEARRADHHRGCIDAPARDEVADGAVHCWRDAVVVGAQPEPLHSAAFRAASAAPGAPASAARFTLCSATK